MSQSLTLDQARHLVLCAQALDRSATSVSDAVERSGFIRTLGGVEGYLGIRARCASSPSRTEIDRCLNAGEIVVRPSVRGCIYLVPKEHAAWSVACADVLSRRRRQREYSKVELTEAEIKKLGNKVLSQLDIGPATTSELRGSLPAKAIRSFGDAGKKIGITSALPPVLRELEFRGLIERRIRDGRLDSEVYTWHATANSPSAKQLAELHQSDDLEAAVIEHIATLYLRSWPLASVNAFAHWSGFGKRLAKAAFEALSAPLGLTTIAVEGTGECLVAEQHLERAAGTPANSVRNQATLLPFLDSAFHMAGSPAFFANEPLLDVDIPKRGMNKASKLRDAGHLGLRSVLLGSELVGFWEYDPDAQAIALGGIDGVTRVGHKAIANEAKAVGEFLSKEVGHGRSFSLDTEKDQQRRVVWFGEL